MVALSACSFLSFAFPYMFPFIGVVQLRGRSGRQGDPGSSRFFLSLEDNIFRIFGGDRIKVRSCLCHFISFHSLPVEYTSADASAATPISERSHVCAAGDA